MNNFGNSVKLLTVVFLCMNVFAKDHRDVVVQIVDPVPYSGMPTIKQKSDDIACGNFYAYSVSNTVLINQEFGFRFKSDMLKHSKQNKLQCRQKLFNIKEFVKPSTYSKIDLSTKKNNDKKSLVLCKLEYPKNTAQEDQKMQNKCGNKYNKLYCGNPKKPHCQFAGICSNEKQSLFPNAKKYDYQNIDKNCTKQKKKGDSTKRRRLEVKTNSESVDLRNWDVFVKRPSHTVKYQYITPEGKVVNSTGYFDCDPIENLKITFDTKILCELCEIEQTIKETVPDALTLKSCAAVLVGGISKFGTVYNLPKRQFNNLEYAQKWLNKNINLENISITQNWKFILTIVLGSILFWIILIQALYTYFCKHRNLYTRMDNEDVPATFLDFEKELDY